MKNVAIATSLMSAIIAPALAVVTFPISRREDYHPDIMIARHIRWQIIYRACEFPKPLSQCGLTHGRRGLTDDQLDAGALRQMVAIVEDHNAVLDRTLKTESMPLCEMCSHPALSGHAVSLAGVLSLVAFFYFPR